MSFDMNALDRLFDRWRDLASFHDRRARPWLFPDPNPMPRVVLFPRVARARWSIVSAWGRVQVAVGILRLGSHDERYGAEGD